MRQPTPEQHAAALERRAKLRALAKRIASMTDSDRAALAARIAPTTVDGHVLSLRNQALVALQRDNATVVGGFQQWRRAGRQVRRGEHAIGIWVPTTGKRDPTGDDSEENTETYFLIGNVFDVSQTEPITMTDASCRAEPAPQPAPTPSLGEWHPVPGAPIMAQQPTLALVPA